MFNKNLYNLTALWKTVATTSGLYHENPEFSYATVQNSEWPNRLWFDDKTTKNNLENGKEVLINSPINLTIPYWYKKKPLLENTFNNLGFKLKSQQVGMSLVLNSKFDFEPRLKIEKIKTPKEAEIWSLIYPFSFGYKINSKILTDTKDDVEYYLVFLDKNPIGTAIVYTTDDTVGVHGVGVIPEARRKGFAEEIMKFILNKAINNGTKISTLQASDMGKGIYLKLGYKEDFFIKNFFL